jgi:HPr kinase/phosphorylase
MKVLVKQIVENFDIEVINEGKNFDKAEIKGFHISSGAYEFLGKTNKKAYSIVGYGSKEDSVFKTMKKEELDEGFKNFSDLGVPAVIVSKTFTSIELVEPYFKKYGITLLKMDLTKAEMHPLIGVYLAKKLSPKETIHASLLNVFTYGILIMGKSGVGKSEVTLELINRGHFFVGDDAIETVQFSGNLYGTANEMLKDHLEVRGIGIVNIKKMYGIHKIMDETKIDLLIELTNDKTQQKNQERLGNKTVYETIRGVKVPKIVINTITSKNISQLIEAATINLKLKNDGYDASEEFIKRVNKTLTEKK